MPQVRRLELEHIISHARSKASAEWIQQLKALDTPRLKVADFGCASGSETLALIWVLDACEACGVDRDISQAERTLSNLKQWIAESRLALPHASQGDYSWWENEVPSFLKEGRLPTFVKEQDIAHPSKPFQLPCDHFDLACCSNLLYQILENQGEEDIKCAVEEMKRVVKLGGWVVADEPDNDTPARFSSIFKQLKPESFRVETYEVGAGKQATTYYYKKLQE
jgi:SAM-dependent methyltransferase